MKQIKDLYQYFVKCTHIATDSRLNVKDSLFFALSGENFNGNSFASSAIEKGAQFAVIDDKKYYKGGQYLLVENTLETLQQLANHHRRQFSIPVISITGSNGKTTTKELVAAVLANKFKINFTKGNLNNHIGVPLSLSEINASTEIAVIEMGANHIGEINRLCQIAQPDIGIITNIGKAHIEGFGSFEGVIQAKSEMYDYIASKNGELVVNSDDELLMSLSKDTNRFTYGKSKQADLKAHIISTKPFVKIDWSINGQQYICNSQLFGKFNFYNILSAIAFGLKFEVPPKQINEAIENYLPDNNRSQQVKTKTNEVILDAYNANPVSMREAILSFKEYDPNNPWIIVGDMFELGHISIEEHKKIVDLLVNESFNNVLLVGKDFYTIKDTHPFKSFKNTEDLIEQLKANPITEATLLIKGSRGMFLEQLMPFL